MQPSIDGWVKENLRYDPETGYLWWTKRGFSRRFDKPVGNLHWTGYLQLGLYSLEKRVSIQVHRIAWFLYYGAWPKNQIDHINNVRNDNRLVNLREATGSENGANRKISKDNSSKYKGVSWYRWTNKWLSRIMIEGKSIHLGYYDNEEKAALAYNKAALEHFGEFAKINIIEPLDTGHLSPYILSSSGELVR